MNIEWSDTFQYNGIDCKISSQFAKGSYSSVHKVASLFPKSLIAKQMRFDRTDDPTPFSEENWKEQLRKTFNRELGFLKEVPPNFKKIQPCPYATFVKNGECIGYLAKNYGVPLFEAERSVSTTKLVLEGLKELYLMNALHFDISSNNILVRTKGGVPKVKFIDFGLSLKMKENLPDDQVERGEYLAEFKTCFYRDFTHVPPTDQELGAKLLMKGVDQESYGPLLLLVKKIEIFAVGALLFRYHTDHHPYLHVAGEYALSLYDLYTTEQLQDFLQDRVKILNTHGCPDDIAQLIVKMIHPHLHKRATLEDIEKVLT